MTTPHAHRRAPAPRLAAIHALLAGGLALGALAAARPAHAAVTVPTVVAAPAGTQAGFELDATIEAVRQSTVGAQASGNVTALLVKAGDTVKAGQALARIDARETQAGLNQSQAAAAQAEANLRNARQNYERTKDLRAQGYVSSAALDAAKAQYDAAVAGRAQAAAGQSQAALARGFTTVAAPYAGVVATTHVQPGDLAVPGRTIVTLYAPQPLRATVQLPMSLPVASEASRVRVELAGGQTVTPTALTLLPAADPVAQTREWRLSLPSGVSAVPGQSVRVQVSPDAPASAPAARAGLSVPAAAVVTRGELTAVYVVQGEQFVLRAVRVGSEAGGQRPVLAGLKAGERVAADGMRAGLAEARPEGAAAPAAGASK